MVTKTCLTTHHNPVPAVTKELTTGLEMAALKSSQQDSFNWNSILLNCSKLYPDLFSSGDEGKGTTKSRPKSSPHVSRNEDSTAVLTERPSTALDSHEVEQETIETALVSPVAPTSEEISNKLNFEKIKIELTTSRRGVLLLQALRWVSLQRK